MRWLLIAFAVVFALGCSSGRSEPDALESILSEAKMSGLSISLDEINDAYQSREDTTAAALSKFTKQLAPLRAHYFLATRLLEGKGVPEALEAVRELSVVIAEARSIPIDGTFAPKRDLSDLATLNPPELEQIKEAIRLLLSSAIASRIQGKQNWEEDFLRAKGLTLLVVQGPTMYDQLHYITCVNILLEGGKRLAVNPSMISDIPAPNLTNAFGYEIGRFRKFIRLTDDNDQEKLSEREESRIDLYRRLNHKEADEALTAYIAKVVAVSRVAKTDPDAAIQIGDDAVSFGKANPQNLPVRVVALQLPICTSLIKKQLALKARISLFSTNTPIWNPKDFEMAEPKNEVREMRPRNRQSSQSELR